MLAAAEVTSISCDWCPDVFGDGQDRIRRFGSDTMRIWLGSWLLTQKEKEPWHSARPASMCKSPMGILSGFKANFYQILKILSRKPCLEQSKTLRPS